jgi:hypothetical protein
MFRFALLPKLALLAAVVLALMLGEPLHAQTPSGTGKTMSAEVLGKSLSSPVNPSSFAGQTIRIRITAADAPAAFAADVEVRAGGQGAGKVSWNDITYVPTSGSLACSANGVVVALKGTRYRNVGGTLVAEGDAHINARPAGGGGGDDIIVFDIIDSISQQSVTARGEVTFSANPCR